MHARTFISILWARRGRFDETRPTSAAQEAQSAAI